MARPPDRPRRARALRLALLLACVGAVLAPAGWMVTDHLEQDDDFCNACHLPAGGAGGDGAAPIPLHVDVRRDFDAAPAASLAAAHARAGLEGRADPRFHCIDCHGGVSFVGRARVKALAAKDALVYLTGRFEEPRGMRWPLWDEDCAQCHADFATVDPETTWRDPLFHELDVHNVELGVSCVSCHFAHEPGGDPAHQFLHGARVRAQCALCHPRFEEEGT